MPGSSPAERHAPVLRLAPMPDDVDLTYLDAPAAADEFVVEWAIGREPACPGT